jgi:GNAT superfamily N-acetyltransferase
LEEIRKGSDIDFRELEREEIYLFGQIDRTETVDGIYYLQDGEYTMVAEHHDVPKWSDAFKQEKISRLLEVFDGGATAYGAFDGDVLVGMSMLDHQTVESGDKRLNLEGMWVSHPFRNQGIGMVLFRMASNEARSKGAQALYVSATPSENTVRFYRRLGCRPADPVDSILFEKEPEDIHFELIF